jgi:DNA-binding MarR family transcriptional regulator
LHKDDIHILRLMGEVGQNGARSQRDLARRLNLSLGLVNRFLKRLVNKGYFKIMTMPKNRVKYFLTPEGRARKSKLTIDYLRYSVDFYREVRALLLEKFRELEASELRSILFFGVGEVAELAYLYMQLTDLRLVGIVDTAHNAREFFGFKVDDVSRLSQGDWDVILLTRLEDPERDLSFLTESGVDPLRIARL